MITAYHRPETLAEAMKLLSRPNAHPLGGGTMLSKPLQDSIEVIDLQSLGLDKIKKKGNKLEIGATTTLQAMLESAHPPPALKAAIKLEAPLNLRNAGTVAGSIVTADGRSTLATVLLALDANVSLEGEGSGGKGKTASPLGLGEFLINRSESLKGKLITGIQIPLNTNLFFETVARTPADKPIVCAALAVWPSGRARLTLGGYGPHPTLALDGTETDGLEAAARNAFHEAGDDWASGEYRLEAAGTLATRCLERLSGETKG
jgi:CO/xanthine dehydrogenase FAD-binding subunit